jgi:hypothetical protein
MKQTALTILLIFFATASSYSQVPEANLLVKIHELTTTEMNAIVSPEKGSLAYNTSVNAMFFYNGADWAEMNTASSSVSGHFIINNSGSQIVNGLPFTPSSVVFSANTNVESISIDSDNDVSNNSNTIANAYGTMNGHAKNNNGTIIQQVIYVGGNGTSINDISRYANESQCIGIRYSNQNGDILGLTTANLTSFNADGFTINVSSKDDNVLVMYTAYK